MIIYTDLSSKHADIQKQTPVKCYSLSQRFDSSDMPKNDFSGAQKHFQWITYSHTWMIEEFEPVHSMKIHYLNNCAPTITDFMLKTKKLLEWQAFTLCRCME